MIPQIAAAAAQKERPRKKRRGGIKSERVQLPKARKEIVDRWGP